jgi:hypothetical protein
MAGVVMMRSVAPPPTGTEYSSPSPPTGNIWLAASSRRLAEKMTEALSRVKSLGPSQALWKVSRVASPPVLGITYTSPLP